MYAIGGREIDRYGAVLTASFLVAIAAGWLFPQIRQLPLSTLDAAAAPEADLKPQSILLAVDERSFAEHGRDAPSCGARWPRRAARWPRPSRPWWRSTVILADEGDPGG